MSLGYGFVAAGLQLGLQAIIIKPKRSIGPFGAYVTISERHHDELEITDHPVEAGAQISDHAFVRPPEVIIECAWSNSPQIQNFPQSLQSAVTGTVAGVQVIEAGARAAATGAIVTGNSPDQIRDIYNRLRQLQLETQLIDVHTGKRDYTDMLIKTLDVETDRETEHCLRVTVTLRQLLIASVRVVTIIAPKEDQADPESTMPPVDKGTVQLDSGVRTFSVRNAFESLETSPLPPLP